MHRLGKTRAREVRVLDEVFGVLHGRTAEGYRINAAGELDITSMETTCGAVRGFLRSPDPDVTVDVTGVTFIDSWGAAFLIDLSALSDDRGGRTVLLDPRPNVLKVIQLVGAHPRLQVRTSR